METKYSIKNKIRGRSCAYPALPLAECVQLAEKIFDRLGEGPHQRLTLAKGWGYASFSGPVSVKIGALVQFGLLERISGNYSVTAAAREIFTYPGETSLPAITAAAARPVLYRKLIAKFSGGSLPQNLAAVLAANYGITVKAAPAAAANFIKTLEFSELLKNGILETFPGGGVVLNTSAKTAASLPENIGIDKEDSRIKIELPSGAAILFPKPMAYRLSQGEFAQEIKNLDHKAGG